MATRPAPVIRRPPSSRFSENDQGTPAWKIATELLGAGASVVLFLYFVGGLIFAARLHALGLPVDAGVALLPTTALLVAAVRALLLALLVGPVVLLIFWFLDPVSEGPSRGRRRVAAVLLLLTLITAAFVPAVLVEPMTKGVIVSVIALGLIALAFGVAVVVRASSRRVLIYGLAAIVLVLGTALRGIAEALPPTSMDFMSVRLKTGHITDGYYLAGDSSTVLLVPNVGGRSIGIVTAVPRSEIAAANLVRESTDIRPIGHERRAFVGRLASLPSLSPEKKRQRDELIRYGVDIRAHTGWRFPPILPVRGLQFLLDNYGTFYNPRIPRPFPPGVQRVPLEALLRYPNRYTGFPVVVRGQVADSAPVWTAKTTERRYLTVKKPGLENMEASCELTRARPFNLHMRSTVDLYVTVLAWGSSNIRAGEAVDETLLACASGKPVISATESKQRTQSP